MSVCVCAYVRARTVNTFYYTNCLNNKLNST